MQSDVKLTTLVGAVFVSFVLCVNGAFAQDLTPAAVERHERAWHEAWNSNDAAKIVELDASGGIGFGYRTREGRVFTTKEEALATTRAFLASTVYFRLAIDEIHTAVDGNIGMAWGYFTEEFQIRGRAPEKVRVRFSRTSRKDAAGWHLLLYHRDAQLFDEKGRYIPVPR